MSGPNSNAESKPRIALVTGASSGLGRAVAELLTERGTTVFAVARDEDRLREASASGQYLATDLAEPDSCARAVSECVARNGGLDILVNVAGRHTLRHTADVERAEWAADLAVNLDAPFFLSQAALPHLLERSGCIVNVASIAGLEGQAYSAGYCAAKHGLVGLTRAMAVEFTGRDIRINAVCPGGMTTPQVWNMTFPEDVDPALILRSATPRGLMDPARVAGVVAFLCSDEASAIHGAVYSVDNGKGV